MIVIILFLILEYILMILTHNSAFFHVNGSLCYYLSMILLIIFMILLVVHGYKYSKDYSKKLLLDYQKELQFNQLNQTESFQKIVESNHSIKEKQLNSLKLLKIELENKNYDNLPTLISHNSTQLYCNNAVLNSLLNIKCDLAKRKNISVDVHIQLPDMFNIDIYDLCTIVFNLLDNAINASNLSTNKYIQLEIIYKEPYVFVNISNSFTDTHNASLMHGYGTLIVEDLVNKYNGYIKVTKNTLYNTNILLTENEK